MTGFEAGGVNWIVDDPNIAGVFTRDQATGAITTGARIVKVNSEPGDSTPNGTGGTVLGSVYEQTVGFAYFIEWDDKPGFAVGTIALKIAREGAQTGGVSH